MSPIEKTILASPNRPDATKSDALRAKNRAFYNAFWSKTYLTSPRSFNTWPLVSRLMPEARQRLEIGPGSRPRLPIKGTCFLDLSPPAVARLNARGGLARSGDISALPFDDHRFDLVAAFDVIEHVADDHRVFSELTRVLKPDGRLLFSVPLHPARWTIFDDCVGHARRYEPPALRQLLAHHGLIVEKSGAFGMQSNNPRLLRYTVRALTRHHTAAVRCYNWLFFPLGVLLQPRLKLTDGLMEPDDVDEILLVCRRAEGSAAEA